MTSLPEENDWVSMFPPKDRRRPKKKSLRKNLAEGMESLSGEKKSTLGARPTPKKKVGSTIPKAQREELESEQESSVGLSFFLGRSLGVSVQDIKVLIESYHRSRVSLEPRAEVVLARILKKLSWFIVPQGAPKSAPQGRMGGGSVLKRFSEEEIVSWMPKFQRFFDPDDPLFLFADDPLENNISHLEQWVSIVLKEICKNPETPNLVVTIHSQRPELSVVVTKLMVEHLSHDSNYSFAMSVNRLHPHLSVSKVLSFLKRRPPKDIKGYSKEERNELTIAMLVKENLTL
jgi:hypothetical protein